MPSSNRFVTSRPAALPLSNPATWPTCSVVPTTLCLRAFALALSCSGESSQIPQDHMTRAGCVLCGVQQDSSFKEQKTNQTNKYY